MIKYISFLQTVKHAQSSPMIIASSHKANILGHEVPLVPCSKLTTNIFHFENCSYLLAEDYYSRFLVIRKLDRMTAKHVTSYMQVIFS